jgi:hypothetical protein
MNTKGTISCLDCNSKNHTFRDCNDEVNEIKLQQRVQQNYNQYGMMGFGQQQHAIFGGVVPRAVPENEKGYFNLFIIFFCFMFMLFTFNFL